MKRTLVVSLAVICAASLMWLGASLLTGSKAVAEGTGVQRWEYKVADANVPMSGSVTGGLNTYGDEGWELVGVVEQFYDTNVGTIESLKFFFKRPLP